MRNCITGMRRQGILAVGTAILLALLISACGGSSDSSSTGSSTNEAPAKQGGTLTVAQLAEANTLNPWKGILLPELTVDLQMIESLFHLNGEGKVEPWLAERYSASKDGKTWTFDLRPGVKFSNGQPMTSADVIFSLEQARKSLTAESLLEPIESVTATSPSKVVIKTKTPAPALPSELSIVAAGIVPKNFGGVSEAEFEKNPIGTGPFMLDQWKHGQAVTLKKNPDYWQADQPYLDKLVFKAVPSDVSRASQLKSGTLDVAFEPPWSQIQEVENTPGLTIAQLENALTDILLLDAKNPLFKSPKAREAISLAINREGIVQTAMSGYGEVAGNLPPKVLEFTDPSIKAPDQDLSKAKALLAEAVKETGVKPEFSMVLFSGETYGTAASQIMQQNLEEVGFTVTLKPLETAAAEELLVETKFDTFLLRGGSGIPDPTEYYSFYVGTSGFFTGANTEAEAPLIEQAAQEINANRRRSLYYEVQKLIYEGNYIITLDDKPWIYGLKDDITGFSLNLSGSPWFAEVGFSE